MSRRNIVLHSLLHAIPQLSSVNNGFDHYHLLIISLILFFIYVFQERKVPIYLKSFETWKYPTK